MSISTFGGAIASNSNTSISGVIGAPQLAPVGFTSSDYVDTGSTFDPSVYPSLAAVYPAKFTGDLWKAVTAPSLNSVPSMNLYGTFISSWTMGIETYLLFSKGHVFKTNGGSLSSLAFFKQIYFIPSQTVMTAVMANTNLYIMYASGQMQVFTEPTLSNMVVTSTPVSNPGPVRYGNGVYIVAFLNNTTATNSIYKSTDGITFSLGTLPTSQIWCGLDYGNGVWSMVSKTTGTTSAMTSPDGVTWTNRTGPATACAGYSRFNSTLGLFVAPIASATQGVATSPDGITWTMRTASGGASTFNIDCTSNGTMIKWYTSAGSAINAMSSTDGITWTDYSNAVKSQTGFGGGTTTLVKYGIAGSSIIMVGNPTATNSLSYVGTTNGGDLSAFTSIGPLTTTGAPANLFPPANLNGTLVSVENAPLTTQLGNPPYAYSSNNGTSWSNSTLPITNMAVRGCLATPSRLIIWAMGSTANITILSSTDGINWTTNTVPFSPAGASNTVYCYNYGETLYFAGAQSLLVTQDYGVTSAISMLPVAVSATTNSFIVTNTGVLLVVNSQSANTAYASVNNGGNWSSGIWAGLASSTAGVACSGPKATLLTLTATASPAAYMLTVDNGQTWLQYSFPAAISASAKSAFYVNGYYFVYVGNNSYYYSTDAINWTSMSTGSTPALQQPWSQAAVSNGVPFISGQVGSYLTGDNTTYHVPFIPTSIAGTKYTVRAT